MSTAHLSTRKKAAILLLRLGTEHAAPLLRSLRRAELNAIVSEVASLGRVDLDTADEVLKEFVETAEGEALPPGDRETAYEYLESTFGERTAREVMGELSGDSASIPFQFLDNLEPEVIAALRRTYHLLFHSKLRLEPAMERVRSECGDVPEVERVLRFVRESERGVIR